MVILQSVTLVILNFSVFIVFELSLLLLKLSFSERAAAVRIDSSSQKKALNYGRNERFKKNKQQEMIVWDETNYSEGQKAESTMLIESVIIS